jgi:hypothetical protein
MATQTVVSYAGDGVTSSFSVPFDYDTQAEVVVTLDGAPASYTYLNPTLIDLGGPLETGSVLTIQRKTDLDDPVVEFRNGSGTTGSQLNAMVKQLLRGLQEATNLVTRALGLNNSSKWDAQGYVLTNLGEPQGASDAVTKAYADVILAQTEVAAAQAITAVESITYDAAAIGTAAQLAEDYANAAVGVQVETGKYSAYHWAVQAQSFAGGATSAATTTFTPAGGIGATNVQAAIQELDTEKSPIGHGHAISAITGLQEALDLKAYADDLTEYAMLVGATFTGLVETAPSTTGGAGLRIPTGVAPTSPVIGDLWNTGSELAFRRTSGNTGNVAFKNVAASISAKYTFSASSTSGAMLNLGQGAAPTSPVDGDLWATTAGLFVRCNGATQQLAGASEVLLASGTIASATAALDLALDAGYKDFRLELADIKLSTQALQMRTSIDGGATYIATATYSYAGNTTDTAGTGVADASAAANAIKLTPALGSNTGTLGSQAIIDINGGITGAAPFSAYCQGVVANSTAFRYAGRPSSTTRPTHIRLMAASGNISEMRYKLYGRV